jgi:hypothetical protein
MRDERIVIGWDDPPPDWSAISERLTAQTRAVVSRQADALAASVEAALPTPLLDKAVARLSQPTEALAAIERMTARVVAPCEARMHSPPPLMPRARRACGPRRRPGARRTASASRGSPDGESEPAGERTGRRPDHRLTLAAPHPALYGDPLLRGEVAV